MAKKKKGETVGERETALFLVHWVAAHLLGATRCARSASGSSVGVGQRKLALEVEAVESCGPSRIY